MHDFIIIGSGPSGAFAAQKILESNKSVLMIDIGDDSSKKAFEIKSFAIKNSEVKLGKRFYQNFLVNSAESREQKIISGIKI